MLHDSFRINDFPYPPASDLDFLAGLPMAVTEFNAANRKLSRENKSYAMYPSLLNDEVFRNIKVGTAAHPLNIGTTPYNYYYYYTGKVFPVGSTVITYFGSDSITATSQSIFDTTNMYVLESLESDARGELVTTKYRYPSNFSGNPVLSAMVSKGIAYGPVRSEVWKGQSLSKLVNSAVSIFSILNDGSIKQTESYALAVEAPIQSTAWGTFNSGSLLQNSQYYKQVVSFDRYDAKGNLIQSTSNGVRNSTIYGYRRSLPIASVKNAGVDDVSHTSFEGGEYDGWIENGGQQIAFVVSLTGKESYALTTNSISKSGLDPNKSYELTVWSHNAAPVITGSGGVGAQTFTVVGSDERRGFRLYRATITNASTVTISCSSTQIAIDELRLHPIGSSMTTYTYDPLFGITSVTDESNRSEYYEYDGFGRLKYKRDLNGDITNAFDYLNGQIQN